MTGLAATLLVLALSGGAAPMPGILLEDLTWVEAEKVLTPETIVVVPLGAESKEHGPHLRLRNDFVMAEYLARRVRERSTVVVAPTVNYGYYPAFAEYPGSTSLSLETSRDQFVEICRGLARFGPKRFYVLNTGVSTLAALEPAASALAADGILMRYTDVLTITEDVEKRISQQEGGTHADEIETSMMLYMSPGDVDMSKAVKDYHPGKGLTRDPTKKGMAYSASGVYGDATLATREKGRIVTEALVDRTVAEIEGLRKAPLPALVATPPVRQDPPRAGIVQP
ncbi:MAG TPA: creatininase family protein [Thermoanaerobaculia bacterium]|nr:creatininase family protein [Thermoanaerobaculia bacterium]